VSFILSILASVFGRLFGGLAARLFPASSFAQRAVNKERQEAEDVDTQTTQKATEQKLRDGNF